MLRSGYALRQRNSLHHLALSLAKKLVRTKLVLEYVWLRFFSFFSYSVFLRFLFVWVVLVGICLWFVVQLYKNGNAETPARAHTTVQPGLHTYSKPILLLFSRETFLIL